MYRRSRRRRARRDHGGVAPQNPRDDRNRLPRVLHPERRRDPVPPRDGCAAAIWPAIESIARARSCWGSPALIEGWAILPDLFFGTDLPDVDACWLFADQPPPHRPRPSLLVGR